MIPLVKTFLPEPQVLMPQIEEVLYSGYIAQGEVVDKFENTFQKLFQVNNCLSVNSGTSALHIALILAGVQPGDEVISTSITAEPTNVAIKQAGAKIIYADIDLKTGNIDPVSVEMLITHRTRAIMVVDYAGVPVNIPEFLKIEKQYNIPIIQDSAHALGAKYKGENLGNHFRYTCFSFQAIKHMTTIDGGMLVIKDDESYEKAKLIRWFGLDKKKDRMSNNITLQGYKYHMNNVNAQIGMVQLQFIEDILKKYIDNGIQYDAQIINGPKVEKLQYYVDTKPSYWLYTLKVKDRDNLISVLKENGVFASPLHKRNDLHTFLKSQSNTDLTNTNIFSNEMLHIPCGWWVTAQERSLIISIINDFNK
ncbi:DegT/DnrJ/EryC1/StrS family aminotransferase [Marivirga harenae]|uniref:DegT/DnrJ/EryC1/StrS family aminotransferase n=1 Tax=Marivirga harenae TaxID=2010992 RepID=UPI0026E0E116|nr:DegT/DnrJ/EryC1/StrS family aminotransferase [Marivirga harenae]WKV13137.1 DegT/DnrJ/EryC1/StrS family aminotransferase [Marivirga harenae]|tara:strand:- start:282813 stop:283907 length:1095 start_codon:yes stop_codon:yes gene_type:complete